MSTDTWEAESSVKWVFVNTLAGLNNILYSVYRTEKYANHYNIITI